jgi:hypothetical protein
MIQQKVKRTPISTFAANLQRRVRSVMTVGDPNRVALPPVNESLTASSKVPLSGEHQGLIAIDPGIIERSRLPYSAAELVRASVPHN